MREFFQYFGLYRGDRDSAAGVLALTAMGSDAQRVFCIGLVGWKSEWVGVVFVRAASDPIMSFLTNNFSIF